MRKFQLIKWVFVRFPRATLPRINVAFARGAFIAGSSPAAAHRKMKEWPGRERRTALLIRTTRRKAASGGRESRTSNRAEVSDQRCSDRVALTPHRLRDTSGRHRHAGEADLLDVPVVGAAAAAEHVELRKRARRSRYCRPSSTGSPMSRSGACVEFGMAALRGIGAQAAHALHPGLAVARARRRNASGARS